MDSKENVQIRRSRRSKRARIVVSAEKVEIVVPLRMPAKQIQQFIQSKQTWIESAKNKIQQYVTNIEIFAPESYRQGAMIPFQGAHYVLHIKSSKTQQIEIEFELSFIAYVPEQLSQSLTESELGEQIRQVLIAWMVRTAQMHATKYMEKYIRLYQLMPRSVSIKTQKSRWGSCGVHNDIYLNWLLVLAPVAVFEYVVVHELCHLQQRNHSTDFWILVAKHCPDYQQHRAWLKGYGASLMLGL